MPGRLISSVKKTIYYLQRNGIRETYYAVTERLKESEAYCYEAPSETVLAQQRAYNAESSGPMYSIVVPLFRTPERYLRELIASVQAQTYPNWELIFADASEQTGLERIVSAYADQRIRYHVLEKNAGIADNTNQGLQFATGEYAALLDHDDLLTPDALHEINCIVMQKKQQGVDVGLIYTDEDKCDGEGNAYYDPHRKLDFNLDLFLTNNYICHFTVMKTALMRSLTFRRDYDGAQDFDIILRAVEAVMQSPTGEAGICHIPKVLYHWRCHRASTAANPHSKLYAYEAGRRVVQDYCDRNHIAATAEHMKHLGFYKLEYGKTIMQCRPDIGAVGGRIVKKGKTIGGCMTADATVVYKGLPLHYSGYMHRAALNQDAEALDLRALCLRKELWPLYEEVMGVAYRAIPGTEQLDITSLPADTDSAAAGVKLSLAIRKKGYRLLYRPDWVVR